MLKVLSAAYQGKADVGRGRYFLMWNWGAGSIDLVILFV